jgi:hypothetical protein
LTVSASFRIEVSPPRKAQELLLPREACEQANKCFDEEWREMFGSEHLGEHHVWRPMEAVAHEKTTSP